MLSLSGKNLNPKAACLKRREEEKAKAISSGEATGVTTSTLPAGDDFEDQGSLQGDSELAWDKKLGI